MSRSCSRAATSMTFRYVALTSTSVFGGSIFDAALISIDIVAIPDELLGPDNMLTVDRARELAHAIVAALSLAA